MIPSPPLRFLPHRYDSLPSGTIPTPPLRFPPLHYDSLLFVLLSEQPLFFPLRSHHPAAFPSASHAPPTSFHPAPIRASPSAEPHHLVTRRVQRSGLQLAPPAPLFQQPLWPRSPSDATRMRAGYNTVPDLADSHFTTRRVRQDAHMLKYSEGALYKKNRFTKRTMYIHNQITIEKRPWEKYLFSTILRCRRNFFSVSQDLNILQTRVWGTEENFSTENKVLSPYRSEWNRWNYYKKKYLSCINIHITYMCYFMKEGYH